MWVCYCSTSLTVHQLHQLHVQFVQLPFYPELLRVQRGARPLEMLFFQFSSLVHLHNHPLYKNGQGVKKDAVQAVSWYRKAAVQGCAQAQQNIGLMYLLSLNLRLEPCQLLAVALLKDELVVVQPKVHLLNHTVHFATALAAELRTRFGLVDRIRE
jgi:hypothetical protein